MNDTPVGTITLKIEGITYLETNRIRDVIDTMVLNGAFNVRNGKVILNFDQDGLLQVIQVDYLKWKRKRGDHA